MIRKLTTALLCILLALALPFGAMAATQTTMIVVPGAEMSKTEAIKDLLDALSIKTIVDGDKQAGALAIGISGEDVASIAVRIAPEGVFAQSEVLGETPLMFDWESITNLIADAFKNGGTDDATVAQIKQAMQAFTSGLSSEEGTITIPEELLKSLATLGETMQKDAKLASLLSDVTSRLKTTEGDFTSEAHDPATRLEELTLTSEDFTKLLDTDTFAELVGMIAKKAEKDDSDALPADEFIKKSKEFFAGVDATTTIAVYTANDGSDLVSISENDLFKRFAE